MVKMAISAKTACDDKKLRLHRLPSFSNYIYTHSEFYTPEKHMYTDNCWPNLPRKGGKTLIECHGSLHWSGCVLEIELVWYTDTEQATMEGRPTGNKICERKQGTGGGRLGERKWVRKWKRGRDGSGSCTLISQTCRATLPLYFLVFQLSFSHFLSQTLSH